MGTVDDTRQALLEKMEDPSLSKEAFDELNRRVKLLGSEE